MEKHIYDEKNGLWYELQGNYFVPCLKLPAEEQRPIGAWGQRHLRYLRQHRKALYTDLCIMYRAVGRNLPPPFFYHNMMHPVISSFDRVVFAFHLQLFAS